MSTLHTHTHTDHYHQVAHEYDTCYEGTHAATLKVILKNMDLQPNDVVVDIGAGTGYLAHQMWTSGELEQPVLCVEPSLAMLNVAKQREGVVPIHASAEEFFANPKYGGEFNKVLMSCCVHHFIDWPTVFSSLAKCQTNGFCVILTRPPKTTLPFFRAAHKRFKSSCTDSESLLSLLQSLGFKTETTMEIMKFSLQKQQWYRMLRERYMSHLEPLTGKEMEDGIAELEKEQFQGVKDSDLITVKDPIIAIVAKF